MKENLDLIFIFLKLTHFSKNLKNNKNNIEKVF